MDRATIDKLKKENDGLKETLGTLEKKHDEKKASGSKGKKANELSEQAGNALVPISI